jgi:hypothetical protein
MLIYKQKKGFESDILIVQSDVVDYIIGKDENVFFMFNPFKEDIISRVIDHISRSLAEEDRQIWLIYLCPFHRDIIEERRLFTEIAEYNLSGSHFIVYSNYPTT